jgi:hypothetical protein
MVVLILIISESFVVDQIIAQDIVLSDTTITTKATFSTNNSITAGPDFTITSSGDVTLRASNRIAFLPRVNIIQGGQLHAMTGVATAIEQENKVLLPSDFVVYQNYPNPFNPSTKIKFALPKPEIVKIEVYNTLGQIIKILLNQHMRAGFHEVEFNAQNLSSGIYYYRIEAGEFQDVKKMILIK